MIANVRRRAASCMHLITIHDRSTLPVGRSSGVRRRRARARSVGAMSDTPSIEVRDVPDDHRYEVTLDGALAGFAIYHRRGGRTFFVHTEIDPAFEGKGLGSALAAAPSTPSGRAASRSSRCARSSASTSTATRSTPTSSTRSCWPASTGS